MGFSYFTGADPHLATLLQRASVHASGALNPKTQKSNNQTLGVHLFIPTISHSPILHLNRLWPSLSF